MFKQLNPIFTNGIAMRLMAKMGWRPGFGLGREGTGAVEPLTLDVKNDRKGSVVFLFISMNFKVLLLVKKCLIKVKQRILLEPI